MAPVEVEQPQVLPDETAKPSESSDLVVEDVRFPLFVTSPKSKKNLFLGGAGVRCLQINPTLNLKVTCLGFYFEGEILSYLSEKWSGKSGCELATEEQFFADIIGAPVEKLSIVTMLKPLPGPEFSKKVMENTKQVLVEANAFGEEHEKAVEEFHNAFKEQHFVPGTGSQFLCFSSGLEVGFHKGPDSPAETSVPVVGNKAFGEALLSTMIGKNSVAPAAKTSIAERLAVLLSKN